jgi:hypothetical protein
MRLVWLDDAVGLRAAEGEAVMVTILEPRKARPVVGEGGGSGRCARRRRCRCYIQISESPVSKSVNAGV